MSNIQLILAGITIAFGIGLPIIFRKQIANALTAARNHVAQRNSTPSPTALPAPTSTPGTATPTSTPGTPAPTSAPHAPTPPEPPVRPRSFRNAVVTAYNTALGDGESLLGGLRAALRLVFIEIFWEWILGILIGVRDWGRSVRARARTGLGSFFGAIWDGIVWFFTELGNGLAWLGTQVRDGIVWFFVGLFTLISGFVLGVIAFIQKYWALFCTAVAAVRDWFVGIAIACWAFIRSIPSRIAQAFRGLGPWVKVALVAALLLVLCFVGFQLYMLGESARETKRLAETRDQRCQAMVYLFRNNGKGGQVPGECLGGLGDVLEVHYQPGGDVRLVVPTETVERQLVANAAADLVLAEEEDDAWVNDLHRVNVQAVRSDATGSIQIGQMNLTGSVINSLTIADRTLQIQTTVPEPAFIVELAGSGLVITVPGINGQQMAARRLDQLSTTLPFWVTQSALPSGGVIDLDGIEVPAPDRIAAMNREQRLETLLPAFIACGHRYGLDPAISVAVAETESGFNPLARSHRGALGVMQFMPATGEMVGLDPVDRTDPIKNICAGNKHLASLIQKYTLRGALAVYNGGPDAVEQSIKPGCETLPNYLCPNGRTDRDSWYGQTRPYVSRILGRIGHWQRELVSRTSIELAEVDAPSPEVCDDEVDNDMDGHLNCEDQDCEEDPACVDGDDDDSASGDTGDDDSSR